MKIIKQEKVRNKQNNKCLFLTFLYRDKILENIRQIRQTHKEKTMNNHISNVVDKLIPIAADNFKTFAENIGIELTELEFNYETITIEFEIPKQSKLHAVIKDKFKRFANKLANVDKTMVLYKREEIEQYILNEGIDFEWDEKYQQTFLPVIEQQIKTAMLNQIKNVHRYIDDTIVEYEEYDDEGEDSYYVSYSEVEDALGNIDVIVKTRNNYYWTVETVADLWEEVKGK